MLGEMKSKKKLRVRLDMSSKSVYIDINDFRCVRKVDGRTAVFLVSQEEPIMCRDSVQEVSEDLSRIYVGS